ncbi:hypothetical protein [Halapricum desulfuricans]|uniref:hypothetical protein n=1 Tax=Halapricum desulfuricans TaxID=2841257 RepID=UPI001E617AED|nr:hypothetical protein [Halapricum desulfuricans]
MTAGIDAGEDSSPRFREAVIESIEGGFESIEEMRIVLSKYPSNFWHAQGSI